MRSCWKWSGWHRWEPKQVTLLGQTVNSYGKFLDDPCTFAHLLERLNAIEGIERIRYTSPYPERLPSGRD